MKKKSAATRCINHIIPVSIYLGSDEVFSKILKKPSHSAEINDTSYERAACFIEMKQKKFKMANSKNLIFQLRQFLIFLCKYHGLVLGLVELIDAKCIGVAQLIWS